MPKQNWSRLVISLILSLVVLGAVLFYVATGAGNPADTGLTPPSVTFLTADGTTPEKISIPGSINGKGVLSLGKFAVMRLDADAHVEIKKVNFDPALASIRSASLELVSGRVWLANLTLGQELQISAGDLTLKNSGGEISLATNDVATQIIAANGDAEITLAPTGLSAPFRAFLTSGKSVTLDPEKIFAISSEPNVVARKKIWEALITNDLATEQDYLDNQFKQDSALLATLTNRFLALEKRDWLQELWQPAKKYLTLLPAAKERYWLEEVEYLFDSAVTKNAENAGRALRDAYADATDAETSAIKQRMLATFIPFTRLTLVETLPEKTKLIVTQLAKLETNVAKLARVAPLSRTLALIRTLNFAEKFPNDAPGYLKIFDAGVNEKLSANDAILLIERLNTYLKNNPNATTPELLVAQQTLATARDAASVEPNATIAETENAPTIPEIKENPPAPIVEAKETPETTPEPIEPEPAPIVKPEEVITPVETPPEIETPAPEPRKIRRPAKSITPTPVDDGKIARPDSAFER